MIEDNETDVFLIREALHTAKLDVEMDVFGDGDRALQALEEIGRDPATCPALIILDINLPKRQGGDVLEQFRKSGKCTNTRVVVVTSSDSLSDRKTMARLGVDEYFRKPSDYDEFMKLGPILRDVLLREKPS